MISYSCTPNMGCIIRAHNRKVLRPTDDNHPPKSCNCRKPESYPLDGNCLDISLVYRATVTAENRPNKFYLGMTESSFKTRYTGHKSSFKNRNLVNDTSLSKYVWELKEKEVNHTIEWSILSNPRPLIRQDPPAATYVQARNFASSKQTKAHTSTKDLNSSQNAGI